VLIATPNTVGITIAQTDEEPESDDNAFSSNSGLEQMTMKAQLKKGGEFLADYGIKNFRFSVSDGSEVCPSNNCEYRVENGQVSDYLGSGYVFESNKNFDSKDLAKFAYDQLVEESTGSKLVEPISCNEHSIGNIEACSFLYAGDDQEGKRYGILEIAFVDDNNLNHLISYRADPVNFDNEKSIIASYQVID
jgi:hypothetical protein